MSTSNLTACICQQSAALPLCPRTGSETS
jgi:hypothetical protein